MSTDTATSHFLRLTVVEDSSRLRGLIDLPDQYATDYTLNDFTVDGEKLSFTFPAILTPTTFTGTFERERISGTFATAAGSELTEGRFELRRAEREAPPYRTEEVRFQTSGVPLRGTVYVPTGKGPHPAVVLLHGAGPQTRESYLRHFAERFAQRGITALIYDKRNTGRADIPLWQQGSGSFEELSDDAAAAVRYLRARPDVADPRRIGLWGHGQGAWVAPLAADKIEGIYFLVMISGGGLTPSRHDLYVHEVRADARGPERSDPDLNYDPRPMLERLRIPVLLILGEDPQAPHARETAQTVESALRAAGNNAYTIKVIPGADDVLLVSSGDGWLAKKPAAGWIDDMIAWVLAHVKRR